MSSLTQGLELGQEWKSKQTPQGRASQLLAGELGLCVFTNCKTEHAWELVSAFNKVCSSWLYQDKLPRLQVVAGVSPSNKSPRDWHSPQLSRWTYPWRPQKPIDKRNSQTSFHFAKGTQPGNNPGLSDSPSSLLYSGLLASTGGTHRVPIKPGRASFPKVSRKALW